MIDQTVQVKGFQKCVNSQCNKKHAIELILFQCPDCNSPMEYTFENQLDFSEQAESQWKNFDMMPLTHRSNICSLGEGDSDIVELEEISKFVNNARVFIMLDMTKNPTGTFKDREASLIISRCKEAGLDNLVFYSTGNTGRAYTHYGAHFGLTTYFFMPKQCHYKNTDFIRKEKNNHIIYVDDHYPQIAPFAKRFAKENGFQLVAPLHDRTEAYATLAYEQIQKLPSCTHFVQTIASGMGPIGFYKGHMNLSRQINSNHKIPKVVCVQSSETDVMTRAYNSGRTSITSSDLPSVFVDDLFEPTLNSTNPVNNYPDLYRCLDESQGIITSVTPTFVKETSAIISAALQKRNILLRADKENSLLIEFAGLMALAKENKFSSSDVILILACGRGRDTSNTLFTPDMVINPKVDEPVRIKDFLLSK
ncbi:threonine synthase [soil metagenome]